MYINFGIGQDIGICGKRGDTVRVSNLFIREISRRSGRGISRRIRVSVRAYGFEKPEAGCLCGARCAFIARREGLFSKNSGFRLGRESKKIRIRERKTQSGSRNANLRSQENCDSASELFGDAEKGRNVMNTKI